MEALKLMAKNYYGERYHLIEVKTEKHENRQSRKWKSALKKAAVSPGTIAVTTFDRTGESFMALPELNILVSVPKDPKENVRFLAKEEDVLKFIQGSNTTVEKSDVTLSI